MTQRYFDFHTVKIGQLDILKAGESPRHFYIVNRFGYFHLKSKAEMTSPCLSAADQTSAPGPIFRGYPNEISLFVALVITPPLVLFKSIQFLKKQCFDP